MLLLLSAAAVSCAGVVDAVLIPEVPFTIKGERGLFKYLEDVLEKKGHCVVCVAEGAGQVRGALFGGEHLRGLSGQQPTVEGHPSRVVS